MASSLNHWIEWSVHTNFSFLVGAGSPADHVNRSCELNYDGIGVCDLDGVYGLAKSYVACEKIKKNLPQKKCPKLFYGTEIHLCEDHDLPVTLRNTVILYALSQQGYEVICKVLTKLHKRGKYDGYITIDELLDTIGEYASTIACLIPMRGALRRGEDKLFLSNYKKLKEFFCENIYQLLSPGLSPSENMWINRYYEMAKVLDVKTLMSQDVFFTSSSEKIMSDLQQAIRTNQSLDEISDYLFVNDERCLKSRPEIMARFGQFEFFESSIRNSIELETKIEFSFSELRYQYPQELVPSGYTSYEWLEKKALDAAENFYRGFVPQNVKDLLLKELSLVKDLGFADYFLTVADIVSWAKSRDILCQGRGSAANSAICFVLGVTSVDPSLFDVLFERFISAERGDPPDIDVDFEHERREEVIAYIYERYGRNRAAMIANVITFKTKGAIRAVGKALGIPGPVLDSAAKYLSSYSNRGEGICEIISNFSKEYLEYFENIGMGDYLKNNDLLTFWGQLSTRLKGYPRHLGIHSGGFMISHLPITKMSPVEPATMAGRTVVQWDKEDVEALGFFKIDILALGMLTAIRKTFDVLRTHYDRDLTLATVPSEDVKTYEMISRADTVGVFQIESRAQMSMLPRLRPKTFYDLVIEVAIIRPGPIQGGLIHPFLKRRDGVEPIVYPHRKLEPILKRTLGVPIFQEQVMRIAMAVGGFSPGEADELRRKMGAWQLKGNLSGLLGKLQQGMKKEGIAPHFIEQTLKQMEAFSAYGFPESHAASFALLAYVSSYLKCHYSAAFFTSLLNSMPMGFYSVHSLIQQVRKEGTEVRGICILSSDYDHKLESKVDHDSKRKDYALRLGFRLVRGLSREGAQRIVKNRSKNWRSMDEFMSGRFLNRADMVALAAAGAFGVFGIDRRQAIWKAHAAALSPHLIEREKQFIFQKETLKEKMDGDFSSFETSLFMHPTNLMRLHYWDYRVDQSQLSDSRKLAVLPDRIKIKAFGLVISRQAPGTANGMVFITLEDNYGFINTAIRPQIYKKFAKVLDKDIFLMIEGTLQKNGGAHSVLINRIFERDDALTKVIDIDHGQYQRNGDYIENNISSNNQKNTQQADTRQKARHPRNIPRFAIRNFH